MTLPDYLILVAYFMLTSFGLGLPIARRITADPLETLCAAPVIGLALSFVFSFLLFATFRPMVWFAIAPLVGAVGLLIEREQIQTWWRTPEARHALLGWVIVAAWIQFLATTIVSFSGGAWGADWLEHHQRAIFFREYVPLRFMFIGEYLLPARPPLVNVVTAGFQAISVPIYACDQVVIGLWSSLAFFPAALWCRRAGGTGIALLGFTALLLVNPAFLQNSTYAWTKLPTAFFTLAGAHFLFRSLEKQNSNGDFALATLALTAAVLAHYSAGPFCAVLVIWWLVWRCRRRAFSRFGREILIGTVIAGPLLAVWFGWSLSKYGITDTLLSNSSVTGAGSLNLWIQTEKISLNLWHTLIPHPWREVDYGLIKQASPAGWFRDYFFMIAQVNLFALLGTGGSFALACALWHRRHLYVRPENSPLTPAAIGLGITGIVVLGVGVHGAADEWGLAHICLQPLGLLGLAVLAANLKHLGKIGWTILLTGVFWDGSVNIALHYWLQAQPPRPEWLGLENLAGAFRQHGTAAFNACLKDVTQVRFLRDSLSVGGLFTSLFVLFGAAVAWWWSDRASKNSQPNP